MADVIRRVIRNQQDGAKVGLVAFASGDIGSQIFHVTRKCFQLLAGARERPNAFLPGRVAWRRWSRPVVVGPFQSVGVIRVDAKVENVFLRQPDVLEQLPGRVLETGCSSTAFVDRNPVDRPVERHVCVFPIENTGEMVAKSTVTHQAIMTGTREPYLMRFKRLREYTSNGLPGSDSSKISSNSSGVINR